MAITSLTYNVVGDMVEVVATSDLGDPWFYWYSNGAYVGRTSEGRRWFGRRFDQALRIGVLDSESESFDPIANAPDGFPPTRTLEWIRSTDADTAEYLIEEQIDGGDWEELARVRMQPGQWRYTYETDALADGSSYAWRVTPIDTVGNSGTAVTIAAETIVRRPDPPDIAVSLGAGPLVTYSEAS